MGDNDTMALLQQVLAYAMHLGAALAILGVFVGVYSRVTPFHEFALIRRGNTAAALSLGGAVTGFCITLFSSITYSRGFGMFVTWSLGALLIQVLAYAALTRMLPDMNAAIESDNIAMGGLMGTMSLSVSIINAACLS